MSYDIILADRIRASLDRVPGLVEKKMFGGIGFLVNGNMACGVNQADLIVRLGTEKNAWALSQPYTRLFDMSGRSMAGWILVEPQGCATESDLAAWLEEGLAFARSLPGK